MTQLFIDLVMYLFIYFLVFHPQHNFGASFEHLTTNTSVDTFYLTSLFTKHVLTEFDHQIKLASVGFKNVHVCFYTLKEATVLEAAIVNCNIVSRVTVISVTVR